MSVPGSCVRRGGENGVSGQIGARRWSGEGTFNETRGLDMLGDKKGEGLKVQ